jgi:hypothetical protein
MISLDDLRAVYAAALADGMAVSSTVAGIPVTVFEEFGYTESFGINAPVVHAGVNYTICSKEAIGPDEMETRLVLERD